MLKIKKCYIASISFFFVSFVYSGTYYTSTSGTATWANATSSNTPCSVDTAIVRAVAGDTTLFLDGTYIVSHLDEQWRSNALNPTNSGVCL